MTCRQLGGGCNMGSDRLVSGLKGSCSSGGDKPRSDHCSGVSGLGFKWRKLWRLKGLES